MARKERMITRTIKRTTVTMVVFDVNTEQPVEKTITLAGEFKTDEDLTKRLKELYETDTEKVVHFKDKTVVSDLFRMTEQNFLANSELVSKDSETEGGVDEEPEEGYLDE